MVIEPAFCGARLVKSTSVGVRERASKAPNLCEAFLLCCSYYLPVHCGATAAYEGTSVKLGAVYGGRVAAQHQQSSSGKIQAAGIEVYSASKMCDIGIAVCGPNEALVISGMFQVMFPYFWPWELF